MTRTLVIQSYRDHDVPGWIGPCLASVRTWAALKNYDYRLVGDEALAVCGPGYLAKVGPNMRSITDLARLEWLKAAHSEGYDLAVWVDADVLVFRPEDWSVEEVARYAMARETWIERLAARWYAFSAVNNCVVVCRRGEPDLDFLILATRHVARHREIRDNFQVGGDLIKGLRASLAFEMLPTVGMFSNYVVRALARGVAPLLQVQARLHGGAVYAANLCAADHYTPAVGEAEAMSAIAALESSRGEVVNGWLDGAPGLAIGATAWFESAELDVQLA